MDLQGEASLDPRVMFDEPILRVIAIRRQRVGWGGEGREDDEQMGSEKREESATACPGVESFHGVCVLGCLQGRACTNSCRGQSLELGDPRKNRRNDSLQLGATTAREL